MNASPDTDVTIGDPATAERFLLALFLRGSFVSTRPTEIWIAGDQKRSRVDFKGIRSYQIEDALPEIEIAMRRSKGMNTNLFYGVCPRFGDKQQFEKAWQIRQAPALWADIDNATVAEVLASIEKAGLPHPSAVVSSGNGVHVYWFLDTPYLIDDVGDPPPVLSECSKVETKVSTNGKSFRVEYFTNEFGDRVNLHNPLTGKVIAINVPDLSAKAVRFQDIVAGIAASIGGDHTFDLARLLRVPGSWNRKNQRNGAAPKPCELVEMTAERFPLERFAEFEQKSPERKRREIAASMPLPTVKKMTAKKADSLADHVATCKIAEDRSGADFALCAFAIENGIAQEEVWTAVSDVGKFSERGRAYFDKTWDKAAGKTRLKRLEKLEQKQERQADRATIEDDFNDTSEVGDDDQGQQESTKPSRSVIRHNPDTTAVNTLLSGITHTFVGIGGNVYARAGRPVVIHKDLPEAIDDSSKLAATLCSVAEFVLVELRGDNMSAEYMPLPAKYGNVWLNDSRQFERLPQIKLFVRCPVFLNTPTGWKISKPGYDLDTGTYYAGPEIVPAAETTHLDTMLAEFCFRSPADRTNYIGMLLTVVLMSRFVGAKPGILLSANQQGTGKGKLAQIIAIIQCGFEVVTIGFIDREEELEKRLGSVVRSGVQTIIVDNAKAAGNRFSGKEIASAVLDRFVTDTINSFRLLGTSTDIRVENSNILAITANQDAISRDLITRLPLTCSEQIQASMAGNRPREVMLRSD